MDAFGCKADSLQDLEPVKSSAFTSNSSFLASSHLAGSEWQKHSVVTKHPMSEVQDGNLGIQFARVLGRVLTLPGPILKLICLKNFTGVKQAVRI